MLLSYSSIQAQKPTFQPITTNDGLSQNSVTSIVQDSFGFLWIATQDGLNRYDGTNFTKYDAYFTDITQEEFSRIGKIYLDSSNRLWRITSNGVIAYYNDPTNTFVIVDTIPNASVIIEKTKNEYWVGSFTEGLFLLSLNDAKVTRDQVIKDKAIYHILLSQEELLLATDQGVLKLDISSNNLHSVYPELENYHISDIVKYQDSSLLISTFNNGLYKTNRSAYCDKIKSIPPDLRIQDLRISKNGSLWIATYNSGIYKIQDTVVTHIRNNPISQNQINYNDILCIYEDRQSNIWIGTDGGGLSLKKANQKPIYSITNSDMPNEMAVDVTRSISTDKQGNIWIGTSGKGLTVIDKNKKNPKHYSTLQEHPNHIPSNRIMSLFHDNNGRLWIGTQEGGLLHSDNNNSQITKVEGTLPATTIWNITAKDDENIWLCTRLEGIILYNTKNNSWKQFKSPKEFSYRVMIKGQDQYYIGTDEGDLFSFREEEDHFSKIELGIETGGIKSLFLDGSTLWIGTQREGIVTLNLTTGQLRNINESNGLPNKVIYALLNQNNRYLWASTNKGICQIDKKSFYEDDIHVVNQYLNYKNGLIGNEFNTGAYHQDKNGTMYFGGIEGVNWFDPNAILKSNNPIDVTFLELVTTTNNNSEAIPLHNKTKVSLPYKNRHFQIRFTDLEFGREENINFNYRLKGYTQEWIQNESNKLISFSNVPPGQYFLQLKAISDNINLSNEYREIEIEIIPVFWQTMLFKIAILALAIYLIWFAINFRIKGIKKASALQQELAHSEATALKAQMNPHFLFNSLNAIDNFILNNDPAQASDYLSKFSKLIRQILDYSNQQNITLLQEIEILKLYVKMEQMRFPSKFQFNIVIDSNLEIEKINIPPLLIQPYVENAIWHGLMHLEYPGKLEIEFAKEKDFLICTITDNGIGRVKAQEIKSKSATKRKSRGMKITNDRIRLLNELSEHSGSVDIIDLYTQQGAASGTKIRIRFPLTQKDTIGKSQD